MKGREGRDPEFGGNSRSCFAAAAAAAAEQPTGVTEDPARDVAGVGARLEMPGAEAGGCDTGDESCEREGDPGRGADARYREAQSREP